MSDDLVARARLQQVEFLKVEVDSGMTFATVALSKIAHGDGEGARHDVDLAQKAYDTILEQMPKVDLSAAERADIERQVEKLRQKLESLKG